MINIPYLKVYATTCLVVALNTICLLSCSNCKKVDLYVHNIGRENDSAYFEIYFNNKIVLNELVKKNMIDHWGVVKQICIDNDTIFVKAKCANYTMEILEDTIVIKNGAAVSITFSELPEFGTMDDTLPKKSFVMRTRVW